MGSLKKNVIYNFAYQLLIMFLPFITAPYLARTIGANGVGVYSFSQSIATYFTYITMLGLANYGNRSIALVQNNREKRSEVFSEIYCMQMLCFVMSIAMYAIYILFFSVDRTASLMMGLWVFSALFDINWLFFGLEQFKITVIRNAIIKVLSVACIFIFVKTSQDTYVYILILSLSTLVSQMFLWPYLKRFVDFKIPPIKNVVGHFKPNLILFLPVIAVSLYRMMDKVMLGYICTMDEVGYYENAEKIITMVQSLIVAVGTVMLPRMTAIYAGDNNNDNSKNKYFSLSITIVLMYVSAAFWGILAVGEKFTDLYFGEGYTRTSEILELLAVTLIFFGAGNVLRTQFLIPKKRDDIYIKSAFLGAFVNFVVNVFLIKKMGGLGAAIGTVIAEMIVCIYQFTKVRKEILITKYICIACKYLVFGIVMYIVLVAIEFNYSIGVNLLLEVCIGSGIYVILLVMDFLLFRKKQNRNF